MAGRAKGNFESVAAVGKATAPAAGDAIATIAAADTKPGIYEIQVHGVYLAGTPAAAEDNNLELRVGATVIGGILMPRATNVISRGHIFIAHVNEAQTITINATGAGTAAVVYAASVIATRIV